MHNRQLQIRMPPKLLNEGSLPKFKYSVRSVPIYLEKAGQHNIVHCGIRAWKGPLLLGMNRFAVLPGESACEGVMPAPGDRDFAVRRERP